MKTRMLRSFIIATVMLLAAPFTLLAKHPLTKTHLDVINDYFYYFSFNDVQAILKLFDEKGEMIIPSQGSVPPQNFYTPFLSNVAINQPKIQAIYHDEKYPNDYRVTFYGGFKKKDGSIIIGHYIKQFHFDDQSNKIKALSVFHGKVYMFANERDVALPFVPYATYFQPILGPSENWKEVK